MNKDIWVYIEQTAGKIATVSLELLGEATRLKKKMQAPGQVAAIIIGSEVNNLMKTVREYGAEKVLVTDDERLKLYQPKFYAAILSELIKEYNPYIFLVGATALGSQLAPTVAAKIKTGVAAHCVELKIDENDQLVAVVPAFGGKVLGDILCPKHRPQMASIKPGLLPKPEKQAGEGEVITVDTSLINRVNTYLKPLSICQEDSKGVPLEEAEIVICGGWGIGDEEHWQVLEKIALRLSGAIACTRPPVDEGWASGEHMMIGTSGKSIRPKIYLGFGISGATHHICGMKDAGLIISVNKDESAEIFKVSDYGIKGDVKDILPLLSEALNVKHSD